MSQLSIAILIVNTRLFRPIDIGVYPRRIDVHRDSNCRSVEISDCWFQWWWLTAISYLRLCFVEYKS